MQVLLSVGQSEVSIHLEQPVRQSRGNDDNDSVLLQVPGVYHVSILVFDQQRMLLEWSQEEEETGVNMVRSCVRWMLLMMNRR